MNSYNNSLTVTSALLDDLHTLNERFEACLEDLRDLDHVLLAPFMERRLLKLELYGLKGASPLSCLRSFVESCQQSERTLRAYLMSPLRVCVIGMSNVGKSTILSNLVGRTDLFESNANNCTSIPLLVSFRAVSTDAFSVDVQRDLLNPKVAAADLFESVISASASYAEHVALYRRVEDEVLRRRAARSTDNVLGNLSAADFRTACRTPQPIRSYPAFSFAHRLVPLCAEQSPSRLPDDVTLSDFEFLDLPGLGENSFLDASSMESASSSNVVLLIINGTSVAGITALTAPYLPFLRAMRSLHGKRVLVLYNRWDSQDMGVDFNRTNEEEMLKSVSQVLNLGPAEITVIVGTDASAYARVREQLWQLREQVMLDHLQMLLSTVCSTCDYMTQMLKKVCETLRASDTDKRLAEAGYASETAEFASALDALSEIDRLINLDKPLVTEADVAAKLSVSAQTALGDAPHLPADRAFALASFMRLHHDMETTVVRNARFRAEERMAQMQLEITSVLNQYSFRSDRLQDTSLRAASQFMHGFRAPAPHALPAGGLAIRTQVEPTGKPWARPLLFSAAVLLACTSFLLAGTALAIGGVLVMMPLLFGGSLFGVGSLAAFWSAHKGNWDGTQTREALVDALRVRTREEISQALARITAEFAAFKARQLLEARETLRTLWSIAAYSSHAAVLPRGERAFERLVAVKSRVEAMQSDLRMLFYRVTLPTVQMEFERARGVAMRGLEGVRAAAAAEGADARFEAETGVRRPARPAPLSRCGGCQRSWHRCLHLCPGCIELTAHACPVCAGGHADTPSALGRFCELVRSNMALMGAFTPLYTARVLLRPGGERHSAAPVLEEMLTLLDVHGDRRTDPAALVNALADLVGLGGARVMQCLSGRLAVALGAAAARRDPPAALRLLEDSQSREKDERNWARIEAALGGRGVVSRPLRDLAALPDDDVNLEMVFCAMMDAEGRLKEGLLKASMVAFDAEVMWPAATRMLWEAMDEGRNVSLAMKLFAALYLVGSIMPNADEEERKLAEFWLPLLSLFLREM